MCLKQSGAQEEKSYWDIRKHLPKKTQGYVPAFFATMYYEYHNEHGIKQIERWYSTLPLIP
jgi:membrane-bound lytic murein transglycosylase D